MNRQNLFYQKNKEKILAKKKAKYKREHPGPKPRGHAWKTGGTNTLDNLVVPPKTDIDRMLDQMERERRE